VLWTYNLPTGSDGVPAVYEVAGREYIAFCVAGGEDYHAPREPAGAAQPLNSYMVFALPRNQPNPSGGLLFGILPSVDSNCIHRWEAGDRYQRDGELTSAHGYRVTHVVGFVHAACRREDIQVCRHLSTVQ